eukprot:CAMPEP_0197034716 /NCGR_PEP_ID=MMETSP1384-20130603/12729_1 /TAXON_ID=29189 /ORGANISM="Ammonia sp." /LENGTH=428 /DNA_ID=CAMNT_0042464671 /DNA_START=355 /DNA_END=1641 /DNA_ORIENTATION=+
MDEKTLQLLLQMDHCCGDRRLSVDNPSPHALKNAVVQSSRSPPAAVPNQYSRSQSQLLDAQLLPKRSESPQARQQRPRSQSCHLQNEPYIAVNHLCQVSNTFAVNGRYTQIICTTFTPYGHAKHNERDFPPALPTKPSKTLINILPTPQSSRLTTPQHAHAFSRDDSPGFHVLSTPHTHTQDEVKSDYQMAHFLADDEVNMNDDRVGLPIRSRHDLHFDVYHTRDEDDEEDEQKEIDDSNSNDGDEEEDAIDSSTSEISSYLDELDDDKGNGLVLQDLVAAEQATKEQRRPSNLFRKDSVTKHKWDIDQLQDQEESIKRQIHELQHSAHIEPPKHHHSDKSLHLKKRRNSKSQRSNRSSQKSRSPLDSPNKSQRSFKSMKSNKSVKSTKSQKSHRSQRSRKSHDHTHFEFNDHQSQSDQAVSPLSQIE